MHSFIPLRRMGVSKGNKARAARNQARDDKRVREADDDERADKCSAAIRELAYQYDPGVILHMLRESGYEAADGATQAAVDEFFATDPRGIHLTRVHDERAARKSLASRLCVLLFTQLHEDRKVCINTVYDVFGAKAPAALDVLDSWGLAVRVKHVFVPLWVEYILLVSRDAREAAARLRMREEYIKKRLRQAKHLQAASDDELRASRAVLWSRIVDAMHRDAGLTPPHGAHECADIPVFGNDN